MTAARRRAAALAALLAGGCVQSHFDLATQQQTYTMTSTDREVDTGRKLARSVYKEMDPVQDEALQARVRGLGERIVAVCDRQELVYSFAVLDEDGVNAFSLPGGYVFVFRELVEKVKSDDELAGVIAHEIAHIVARHAVKRFEGGLGLQLVQLATLAAGRSAAAKGLTVAGHTTQLAYARQDELDADRLAVKYLQAAGFDPKAVISFLETLQKVHADRQQYLPRGVVRPSYAMTHPYVPDRLRAAKEALYGVADYIDYLNTSP